jgi:hypothetical protein
MLYKSAIGVTGLGVLSALKWPSKRAYLPGLLLMCGSLTFDAIAILLGFKSGVPILDELALAIGAFMLSRAVSRDLAANRPGTKT